MSLSPGEHLGRRSIGAPCHRRLRRRCQIVELFGWTSDVSADGERFLVREPLAEGDASPVTILTEWTTLLARR